MPISNDLEIQDMTLLVQGSRTTSQILSFGMLLQKTVGVGGGGNIVAHQEYRLYNGRWAGVIAIVCTSVVPRLSVSAFNSLSLLKVSR